MAIFLTDILMNMLIISFYVEFVVCFRLLEADY